MGRFDDGRAADSHRRKLEFDHSRCRDLRHLQFQRTATLALAGGAAGETVTFTNGIVRNGNATVFIDPSTTTSLGNTEKVFSTAAPTLVNG